MLLQPDKCVPGSNTSPKGQSLAVAFLFLGMMCHFFFVAPCHVAVRLMTSPAKVGGK